ncbi:hypothetical protein J6590_085525 [Homalodisca vitripennis]|nr:hypothetical protein J6590_085525 [Homalodisca vitripennis]
MTSNSYTRPTTQNHTTTTTPTNTTHRSITPHNNRTVSVLCSTACVTLEAVQHRSYPHWVQQKPAFHLDPSNLTDVKGRYISNRKYQDIWVKCVSILVLVYCRR